jgi:hypothetical protein
MSCIYRVFLYLVPQSTFDADYGSMGEMQISMTAASYRRSSHFYPEKSFGEKTKTHDSTMRN